MGEEERLRSLITKLQSELSVLDRVVYKNKNQHRRSRYFQYLLKVRRDLKLLEAAKLSQILNALFPIIDSKRAAERALRPNQGKKQSAGAKYSYHERLLGVARLLSEMSEPIIKAAMLLTFLEIFYSQISLLVAKSFFVGFSTMVLALLGRIRVIVQQMLLDVVMVFNKVSEISQCKQNVKLIEDGVEVFREYYPVKNEVVILECQWKEDKFVLLEKLQNENNSKEEDGDAIPCESTIQYSTILLFDEDVAPLNNISSGDQSDDINHEINVQMANPDVLGHQEEERKNVVFVSEISEQQEKRKNVAFVSVDQPKTTDPGLIGSNKRPKLDLDAAGSGLPGNLFDDLEFSESMESSIF